MFKAKFFSIVIMIAVMATIIPVASATGGTKDRVLKGEFYELTLEQLTNASVEVKTVANLVRCGEQVRFLVPASVVGIQPYPRVGEPSESCSVDTGWVWNNIGNLYQEEIL